ncbi:MAG: hypothetical protein JWN29_331 [Acidimicrobiales bacterium]|nr:hypothetical protein [Acidimicrobiales bacterium]
MTRRRWLLVAGLLVVAWAVGAGMLLARAASALGEGRDAARAARDGVDASALADGRSLPDLRRARDRFGAARSATGNPILLPLRVLPVVGRQLRSVHALAGAAHEVSDAAVEAVTTAHQVLRDPKGGGPARVDEVRILSQAVSTAARRVNAVVDLGPRQGLVRPLADARNELARHLTDARQTLSDAAAGSAAGLRLLEGPRRYLVIAANNAEMRAGSGMWLSGGVLTTGGGRLDLGDVAPLYLQADPPDGAAAIEDRDLADRWDALWHPNWDWRGLMVSPRMPASAALGLEMWRAAGQEPIDGVLVIDPVAVAAVVRATGPVEVAGRTVTADEIVPLLLHDQYRQFNADRREQDDRREALGAIANAAFAKLDEGGWSPATLAGELAAAVGGRHLLAWSADPVEQRGWVAAGLDGDLRSDSLLVSVLNRGGNKLDWFLPADAELVTRPVGSDTEVTVRLRFDNRTPSGLPRYVSGPTPGQPWPPGRYVGLVTVNVPGAATDVTIDGVPRPVVAGRDGAARVVATELQLDAGASKDVTVRFRLAGPHGSLRVEPSARVPGITWRHGTKTWEDSRRRTAKW